MRSILPTGPMAYLSPLMRYKLLWPTLALLSFNLGCKKDEPPLVEAQLHAECRECIVRYATGVLQSKRDTLTYEVDPGTGDTLPATGNWTVHVKQGENLFLQACYLIPDSAIGNITVWVTGEAGNYEAQADTAQDCATINQLVE